MAIPKIKQQDIHKAFKYIDEYGVPSAHARTKYELISDEGKSYPPKYVVAVADYLANGGEKPSTKNFDAVEARRYLEKEGFEVKKKESMSARQISKKTKSTNNEEVGNYASELKKSYNIIFRGPPGTGKTYLAQSIAAYLVTEGKISEYSDLLPEQRAQIEMVQFHPNYDYSDFVEGLRPVVENGVLGFDLKPGIFKSFIKKVREEKKKSKKKFVFIIDEINRGEISKIFGELFFSIDPEYRGEKGKVTTQFANLHNSEKEDNDKFFVPENVYIIGTMNDIDRSVDCFDFAMRRRFRFIELRAEDCLGMLSQLSQTKLNEAKKRMSSLNEAIKNKLNENYQVGGAYFAKLKRISSEELWTDYLEPLLREYIRGMNNEEEIMEELRKAYDV